MTQFKIEVYIYIPNPSSLSISVINLIGNIIVLKQLIVPINSNYRYNFFYCMYVQIDIYLDPHGFT